MKTRVPPGSRYLLLSAAFVICVSSGIHELAITRLASAYFFHDIAYLSVSACLLALGTGAAAGTTGILSKISPWSVMVAWGFLSSVCAVCASLGTWAWWSGIFALPMVATGLFLALAYVETSRVCTPGLKISENGFEFLYAIEIAGFSAGLGIFGPLLLPLAGPEAAIAFSAILPPLWALVAPKGDTGLQSHDALTTTPNAFHAPRSKTSLQAAGVTVLVAIAASLATSGFIPGIGTKRTMESGMTHLSEGVMKGRMKKAGETWSAFAKTDLAYDSTGMAMVFTDGMFCARAPSWDGSTADFDSPSTREMASFKRVPYILRPPGTVLVMGSGAGFDNAVALQNGAGRVIAVEVNPDMVAVASSLSGTTGVTYLDPRVNIEIAEARKFAETFTGKVDHISLSLMETSPASIRGRTHVHTSTLTVEAFKLYLSLLKPHGIITVINNTQAFHDRCAAAARAALGQGTGGIVSLEPSAKQKENNSNDSNNNNFRYQLMVSREPFSPGESETLDRMAKNRHLILGRHSTGCDGPTDDKPFFFSGELAPLHGWAAMAAGLSVFAVLFPATGFILLRHGKKAGKSSTGKFGITWLLKGMLPISTALFLASAGVSACQVGVLHRAGQIIGTPSISMGTGLAAMVAGAGAGALVWGRLRKGLQNRPAVFTGWIPAVISFTVMGMGSRMAAAQLAGVANPAAGLAAAALTALFFIPAGIPFLEAMKGISCQGVPKTAVPLKNPPQGIGLMADGCGAVFGAGIAVVAAPHLGIASLFHIAAGFLCLSAAAMTMAPGSESRESCTVEPHGDENGGPGMQLNPSLSITGPVRGPFFAEVRENRSRGYSRCFRLLTLAWLMLAKKAEWQARIRMKFDQGGSTESGTPAD